MELMRSIAFLLGLQAPALHSTIDETLLLRTCALFFKLDRLQTSNFIRMWFAALIAARPGMHTLRPTPLHILNSIGRTLMRVGL